MTVHRVRYRPGHPKASASGCVYEHVLVAESALGRELPAGAEVHHVDENPRNNTATNLVICESAAYHKLLHSRTRVVKAGGNPNTQRICSFCRKLLAFTAFNRNKRDKGTGLQRACRSCQSIEWKKWR